MFHDLGFWVSDLVLSITLQTNAIVEHSVYLSSPPFSRNVSTCLQVIFMTQTRHNIRLTCTPYYVPKLLYRLGPNPAATMYQTLLLDIPSSSNSTQCSLTFSVSSSTAGSMARFDSIQLLPGTCPPIGKFIN
jgi:hypothetical protein